MTWQEEFLYPTKSHYPILAKYQKYLNSFLGCKVIHLGFARWTTAGELVVLSSTVEPMELFLETRGYEDSPFFLNKSIHSKYQIIWDGYSQEQSQHNLYQRLLTVNEKVDITLFLVEKDVHFNQYFCLDLHVPLKRETLADKKCKILKDILNKIEQFNYCIFEIKKELFPILEHRDVYRINVNKILKINRAKSEENSRMDAQNLMQDKTLCAGRMSEWGMKPLGDKEQFCLDLYRQGNTMDNIAAIMRRSPKTIEHYLDSVKNKLGATDRSSLFFKARLMKMINEEMFDEPE